MWVGKCVCGVWVGVYVCGVWVGVYVCLCVSMNARNI